MSEDHIAYLFKAAAYLSRLKYSNTQTVLKSYYLMRCHEISKGFRLPTKQFSNSSRCPHCCIQWSSRTDTKILRLKLSKRQKRRRKLRQKNITGKREEYISKRLEMTCNFCNNKTTVCTPTLQNSGQQPQNSVKPENKEVNKVPKATRKELKKPHLIPISVYCKSKEAFSLINQNNTLKTIVKHKKKEIKNNKKKKDKFAGLCQNAVLFANKIKQTKEQQNKINLFLKPS